MYFQVAITRVSSLSCENDLKLLFWLVTLPVNCARVEVEQT